MRRLVRTLVVASAAVAIASCGGTVPSGSGQASPSPVESLPAASASAEPTALVLPDPEVTSFRAGISTLDPDSFLLKWTEASGTFQKYGLDAEVLFLDGTQAAATAVHAGQVDVINNTVTQAILSLLTDDPVVEVAITTNGFRDILFSGPEIKTGDDLRGKRVAISQFGGQSHAIVVVALKELGLEPSDANIVQIGGQSARVAALLAGSVDAAPASPDNEEALNAEGMNSLVYLEELAATVPYAGSDVGALRSWIDAHPNTMLRIVAAVLEAQQLLYTDTQSAVAAYAEWAQLSEADAKVVLDEFVASPVGQRDLRWTLEGFENNIPVLESVNPEIVDVDVTKAYDTQFLDRLEEIGFNELVGVP